MKPNDLLWVGLKLLGAYLIVYGLATTCSTSYYTFNLNQKGTISPTMDDYVVGRLWEQIITGSIFIVAGVLLVTCTSILVRRSHDCHED